MTIPQDIKQPVVAPRIELFILELPLGGGTLRFTPHTAGGATSISYGGNAYTAMPIEGNGWERSIDGAPPQPTLKISNITKFIQPYLTAYDDLVGARVTRIQTLSTYLDNGSSPDGSANFDNSVYIIEQKLHQNKREVEFKLTSVIDAPQLRLPRGQVLRSIFPGAGLFRKS